MPQLETAEGRRAVVVQRALTDLPGVLAYLGVGAGNAPRVWLDGQTGR